jgi:hypothetical protein
VIVLGREPSISNFHATMRCHFENARLLPTEYEVAPKHWRTGRVRRCVT